MAAGEYGIARIDAGPFALTELLLPGRLSMVFSPVGLLMVSSLQAGRAELRSGDRHERLGSGDVCLDGRPDESRTLLTDDLRISSVLLPGDLVGRAADDASPRRSRPLHFTDLVPAGLRTAALWQRTADFARCAVLAPGGVSPLVAAETARLLAATAPVVFPNDLDTSPLMTTPLDYARRVRLDHAHTELQDADPGAGATGPDIASRRGFTHAGRFAAAYRRAYGEPPRTTLRR
ncbi:helix-turn-helix domain-containing protein [Streptomyces sp. NPDC032472]|uniref:helix-turn-helix domain-containing protein n=1 Tax=Streptomyces sp. NPDC032472 TaxID=3155018 RepID=UPI0033F36CCB